MIPSKIDGSDVSNQAYLCCGNKLVELMHLNARVAKPNLSSSKKRKLFLFSERKTPFCRKIDVQFVYKSDNLQYNTLVC